MKLYDLSADMQAFLAAVEAGEIPEEAIADTLDSIQSAFVDKLDDCAAAYKSLLYEAEAIKAERDKLNMRMTAKKNAAQRLKDYIDQCMRGTMTDPKQKIETSRSVLSYRKSESLVVDDKEAVLNACGTSPEFKGIIKWADPEIDKTALKKVLKAAGQIPGAHIEQNYNLQIK